MLALCERWLFADSAKGKQGGTASFEEVQDLSLFMDRFREQWQVFFIVITSEAEGAEMKNSAKQNRFSTRWRRGC